MSVTNPIPSMYKGAVDLSRNFGCHACKETIQFLTDFLTTVRVYYAYKVTTILVSAVANVPEIAYPSQSDTTTTKHAPFVLTVQH